MAEDMEEKEDGDNDEEPEENGGGYDYMADAVQENAQNDAFCVPTNEHIQLQPRSPSPEGMHARKRRRRLNAEELAVADGLLGLQEVGPLNSIGEKYSDSSSGAMRHRR